MNKRWLRILTVLGAVLLLGTATQAAYTGILTGRVSDSSNNPIPGVMITVSGENLQGTRSDVTNENGLYRLAELPPGGYMLKAELMGMKTIEKTKTILKTTDHSVYLKAWAEEECRLQAQAGRVGHFRRTPAGARFVGVGSGGKTCMTSGEPLAVAHFGGYSCRVW